MKINKLKNPQNQNTNQFRGVNPQHYTNMNKLALHITETQNMDNNTTTRSRKHCYTPNR